MAVQTARGGRQLQTTGAGLSGYQCKSRRASFSVNGRPQGGPQGEEQHQPITVIGGIIEKVGFLTVKFA